MVIPISANVDWLKAASVALLLHLIGFDGILLSAKRGESNRGGSGEWVGVWVGGDEIGLR